MPELTPTIVIDTREQTPLPITSYTVVSGTLPVGDYGILGFSDWNRPDFIIERKSIDDLTQSLTHGRNRFMREIHKLRQFIFAAIVIEARRDEVEMGLYRSAANPTSILASLQAIQVRYGVHVVWAGDHEQAAREVEGFVRQFARGLDRIRKDVQSWNVGKKEKEHDDPTTSPQQ